MDHLTRSSRCCATVHGSLDEAAASATKEVSMAKALRHRNAGAASWTRQFKSRGATGLTNEL